MSEKPISPLRRRMIEDMTVRNFVEKTRNDYIRHVRTFTAFLGRAPDTATPEDLRLFQLHQAQTGARAPSINGSVVALRFFFTVTLDRPEMARHLTFVREPRRIPVILSLEEIARLLEAAPGPKYKAALSAAYGAGLRVSEVVALKVSDIDSERMLLRIEQGKGRKDRFAMLSPRLLELLRDWYRIARPTVWLFPGRDPLLPLTTRQFNRAVHAAADRAPVKVIVYNNSALGLITLEAESVGLVPFREAIEFPNPDFAALARACGGHGFTARKPNDLMAAIAEALAVDGPAIVDAVVASDEMPNMPHVELEQAGHYAIAKIKEAVLAVTGG